MTYEAHLVGVTPGMTTHLPWPNLFIPGAAKCATSTVAALIAQHPEIVVSTPKEPHFFRVRPFPSRVSPLMARVSDRDRYLSAFGIGPERYRCDASTSYLSDPFALKAITDVCPNARFIICIRNPVDRAWSHYNADCGEGVDRRTFSDAVKQELSMSSDAIGEYSNYVRDGLYAEALTRFIDVAGEFIHVVTFEDLLNAHEATLAGIWRFLDVPLPERPIPPVHINEYLPGRNGLARRILGSGHVRKLVRAVLPQSVRRRGRGALRSPASAPPMNPDCREFLLAFYHEDVSRTEKILGRKLSWNFEPGPAPGSRSETPVLSGDG